MGEVIEMFGGADDGGVNPFGAQSQVDLGVPGIGQQAPAPEAGRTARQGPPKSVLRASLARSDAYAKEAVGQLTRFLPPGAAQGELKGLLESYAVIQENVGVLVRRIAEPDLDVGKDIRELEKQVQAFVESSVLVLRKYTGHGLQGLGQTEPTKVVWPLWLAAAVGISALAYTFWPRKRRMRALPAR